MPGKRERILTIRVADEERAELERSAAAAKQSLSDYIRTGAMRDRAEPGRPAPTVASKPQTLPFGVNHIDDLGPDPLRGRDHALIT